VTGKPQKFGGAWSLIKTRIVAAYLQAYSKALKQQGFHRTYIDAFAGSGAFSFDHAQPLLFDDAESATTHAGSVQHALSVSPAFDESIFIEKGARNVKSLEKLIEEHPTARVIAGDANDELLRICDPNMWRPRKRRGVIFLDPFGLDVAWATLEAIAKTQALDLWYLFSLSGLYRNAPISLDDLAPEKRSAVARAIGIEDWVEHFYRVKESRQGSLFNDTPGSIVRTLSVDDMEHLVSQRLKEIFPYVAEPRRLYGPTNAPLFSLFFAVSNPNGKAIRLASKIAEHILRHE